jgi:sulfate adenylyltransferase large subunit
MAAHLETPLFSATDALLAQDQAKDLLRFTTAGSVDDGKSTLIGRLLYDSRNVFEDQIRSVAKVSATRGDGSLDLSLLTDGLRAEREQGITIDVAYRYFSTARRKFIIADTPGHEQYTRNMATGASTADLAIVLIDARHGVLPQSRRHACIAHLLGIPRLVVAVNKMDVAGYDEKVFRRIQDDFTRVLAQIGEVNAWFVPISALKGDNVVHPSTAMPWFEGPNLLEYLETVDIVSNTVAAPFRLPVQYVIRPNQDFRGYAGQISAGVVRPGDEVLALPAGRRSRVKTIATFDGDLAVAHAPMSVTLTLEDEIDISRGDMLVSPTSAPAVARVFEADVVWMSDQPLDRTRPLLLKHTVQTVKAEIEEVVNRLNIETLEPGPAETLALNAIGVLRIRTAKPLYVDRYQSNRATGSFILLDPATNATIAAGMIRRALLPERHSAGHLDVTASERQLRFGHTGAIVRVGDRPEVARNLERRLFDHGCAAVVVPGGLPESALEAMRAAGLLVLTPDEPRVPFSQDDAEQAADALFRYLENAGILARLGLLAEGEGI